MKTLYNLILSLAILIPAVTFGAEKGKPPAQLGATVINSTTVKLSWMGTQKDQSYRVRVRPVGVLTWSVYNVSAPSCTRRISDLVPGTAYQWQVQTLFSKSPRDTSVYTNGPTFKPWEPCEAPQGLMTMLGSSNQAALMWVPSGNDVEYIVYLREENSKDWMTYTTDKNVLMLNGLELYKGYEWFATTKCKNSGLESEKSDKSFFAASPAVLDNIPIGNYDDYDGYVVTFNANGDAIHQATLQNHMGQQVGCLPVYYTSSNGTVAFNVDDSLPPGLYNLSYRCGNDVQSQTLLIAGDY